ncbi:YvrJ family protein [Gracilibacillus caseinilyticus]|uniref:YvrJ family protein n=2 Tax=Gracilibacillus caseinilyticus TaxID=2932256 RepID=A0ABY4F3L3_9BACI|nr:YvrJ family protein [Gracilibacillus caseinilyticus]UOQ50658.1 YvrJ family protein [Gracilibacillus caseinilyticus]
MDDTSITNLISNVGFPIVITLYLLYRFEMRLKKLEDAIWQLGIEIKGGIKSKNE